MKLDTCLAMAVVHCFSSCCSFYNLCIFSCYLLKANKMKLLQLPLLPLLLFKVYICKGLSLLEFLFYTLCRHCLFRVWFPYAPVILSTTFTLWEYDCHVHNFSSIWQKFIQDWLLLGIIDYVVCTLIITCSAKTGGHLNKIRTSLKYLCPAEHIPPKIEVDVSKLDIGDRVFIPDVEVHPSMKLLSKNETMPICKIVATKLENPESAGV